MWMPWCLCECYWLSSKLTQQVMLLEGCALVMLPLENFWHCRLPLVFSCHCITIIFCFKKSYFSFNYGTDQNKHNRMSWPVMTSCYLQNTTEMEAVLCVFCMVWKQLRSWMWQFSNNMSYWWASHAEGMCGFPQEGCLRTGGHCAKLRPIQGACGKTGPSALCTSIQHCTRPALYVSQWHSWACQLLTTVYPNNMSHCGEYQWTVAVALENKVGHN